MNDDTRMLEALREELTQEVRLDAAREHPAFLLQFVRCVDSRSGDAFEFQLLTRDEAERVEAPWRGEDWHWQRSLLDWILAEDQSVILKGRQLGVTWVACGLALWYLLYRPGADVLIYSITEAEAVEVVQRVWDMLQSLPSYLMNGGEVLKPNRGRPTTEIQVIHPDKRVSTITGMPATESAGHSRSAALVVFDEVARNKYARAIWKAVVPASGDRGGKIAAISTANGMADGRTGDGNWFHYLWVKSGTVVFPRLKRRFLGWWLHPERDQAWYDAIGLDPVDRAEQYPNEPDEAFLLSGRPYFDFEALKHYGRLTIEPRFSAAFEPERDDPSRARLVKSESGWLEVYAPPHPGLKYALAVDVATGSGQDFSVGAVIDLHTAEPCAELYMKADYEQFAEQLHFLGLWYNGAVLAVEKGGGYGDTVIAYLRDGLKGRRPYPKLYRHHRFDRPDRIESRMYGFPMNIATRPKVVSELRTWVNDRLLPYTTHKFLAEARTFVYRDVKPSPAAADGCNDDVIMAWGIALELYAQFGEHEFDRRKKTREKLKLAKPKAQYPWEPAATR